MCAIWWPPPSSIFSLVMKSLRLGVVVELRARIGVRDRNLDRLAVQRLGEVDRVADRLLASRPAGRG